MTMQRESLAAPWRITYIRSIDRDPDCFVCRAAQASTDAERAESLVLWSTPHSVVLMNRYPYTNGHLMISPLAHKHDLCLLTPEELLDLNQQTIKAIELLRRAMSPQGFNVGINLDRCAGAGVPGHLHQHLVPRWSGDVNFMEVVAQVRIIPQATEELYKELISLLAKSPL